jgi:hypothetical protein
MISEAYKAMNAEMHRVDDSYGRMGGRYADHIRATSALLGIASILDYGCGKHTLRSAMPDWGDFREYDPALPGYDARPAPADLVTCTDVMEHIEPEHLAAVLDDIQGLAVKGVFFVITMTPAARTLPDGTNPHKICEPEAWWLPLLMQRWRAWAFENNGKRFFFVGKAL